MILRSVLLCQLVMAFVVYAGQEGSGITCVCSTTHCMEHRMYHCNTTGMCFSQYLDRHDGSHPVIRGCISSKTPLLCENRRPAIVGGSWPVLICCNSNLCNRDVVPTAPPWFPSRGDLSGHEDDSDEDAAYQNRQDTGDSDVEGVHDNYPHRSISAGNPPAGSSSDKVGSEPNISHLPENDRPPSIEGKNKNRSRGLPHIVSPVYISVLVLGVVSLVIIGIVAAIVLRRNNRFYTEQYGALERNEEYFKRPLEVVQLTPGEHQFEVEPMPCFHPKPYTHVIYGNKVLRS